MQNLLFSSFLTKNIKFKVFCLLFCMGVKLGPHIVGVTYEGEPKNNRSLNVTRELEVVARCAARCHESTQYTSSLSRGVSLGWLVVVVPTIHLHIILPSMPVSSKWYLSLRFPHQIPVCTSPLPIRATCPAHPNLLEFIIWLFGEECRA